MIVHPKFNDKNLHNDLAILTIEEDFSLTNHISVTCLPNDKNFQDFSKDGCVATGWGKDSIGKASR